LNLNTFELNRAGDIVIDYTRTGTRIFPEERYDVYLAKEPDIRPSRLLKAGEAPYGIGYTDWLSANVLPWGDWWGLRSIPQMISPYGLYEIRVGKIRVDSQVG
jgi:hypothetical protein